MTTEKTLKRRADLQEVRVTQLLSLLAKRPLYRDEICRAMGISLKTMYKLTGYARSQCWIVVQGKYYINPHTVMVADGKIVRDYEMEPK